MPTTFNLPSAGDVILMKRSRDGLLVISAGQTQSQDPRSGVPYTGYAFKTIRLADIGQPNPTEKTWTLDYAGSSLGGENMVKPDAIRTIQSGVKINKTTTYSVDLTAQGWGE